MPMPEDGAGVMKGGDMSLTAAHREAETSRSCPVFGGVVGEGKNILWGAQDRSESLSAAFSGLPAAPPTTGGASVRPQLSSFTIMRTLSQIAKESQHRGPAW